MPNSADLWAPQRAAVRTALSHQGWSQAEFADELGITEKHLSRILNGRDDGTIQLWSRIANTLGCMWTLSIGGA